LGGLGRGGEPEISTRVGTNRRIWKKKLTFARRAAGNSSSAAFLRSRPFCLPVLTPSSRGFCGPFCLEVSTPRHLTSSFYPVWAVWHDRAGLDTSGLLRVCPLRVAVWCCSWFGFVLMTCFSFVKYVLDELVGEWCASILWKKQIWLGWDEQHCVANSHKSIYIIKRMR
jgi:hypothetical protein